MIIKKQTWCFDIDGVLIDSRDIVKESYKKAGVDMPNEAWGHPWQSWLPNVAGSYYEAAQLHSKKTEIYVELLKNDGTARKHALPFAEIARALERDPVTNVYYVTGASNDAATSILKELGLNVQNLVGSSLTTNDRESILKKLDATGVYVDDRIEGQGPALSAGWNFVWAKQDWSWKR
jgi:FMN phosphatase YigB (HAD superfamily)